MKISMRHQKGFTIAELLVVMAIIGIMTTLVLANFQSGRRSTELRGASTKLLQDIRLAQSYTIAGNSFSFCQPSPTTATPYVKCQLYSDCGPSADIKACKNTVPTNGYGIFIGNQDTYQVFGDTNPDGTLTPDDYQIINQDNTSNNIHITGYKVYSTSSQTAYDPATVPVAVTFSPPEGTAKLYVNGTADITDTNVDIVVKSAHIAGFCRRVSVNLLSGQVSENQGSCTP